MYYVHYVRSYSREEMIAECRTLEAAQNRADEEFANGAYNTMVLSKMGILVYEPEEEFLFDEL